MSHNGVCIMQFIFRLTWINLRLKYSPTFTNLYIKDYLVTFSRLQMLLNMRIKSI